MKKSTFKFTSLLLSTAIASTLFSFSAGAETTQYNVSATETTRIEGEAASEVSGGGYGRTINEGEKALTYASVKKEDGMEYYAKYVVNTEFAGTYSLNAVASIRSQTYIP